MATAPAPKIKIKIAVPVIETVPVERLKPWKNNPRLAHAVDRIAISMAEFGYVAPIIVQKGSYRIIAGHGRYEATKKLKIAEVPVVVVDLTEDQADLYAVADNKISESSLWDWEELRSLLSEWRSLGLQMDLTGFSDRELKDSLAAATKDRESPDDPPPGGPGAKPSPTDVGSLGKPKGADPSPAKSINLFFSDSDYAECVGLIEKLAVRYSTSSLTETVVEAVRRQAKE